MTDTVEALERLARLKSAGMLTEREFQGQKAILLGSATPRPATPMTFGEHFAEGRRKSRGVRRFFRWFWGIQFVAILLVGIYFLTRGWTLHEATDARDAHQTAKAANEEITPAQPEAATEVSISDEVIAGMFKASGSWSETNSQDVCVRDVVQVVNRSSKPLDLDISDAQTSDTAGDIGHLEPGQGVNYRTARVGRYIIGKVEQGVSINLFLLNVVNCHNEE